MVLNERLRVECMCLFRADFLRPKHFLEQGNRIDLEKMCKTEGPGAFAPLTLASRAANSRAS